MFIEMTCTCGRKLRVGVKYAGQQGKCPACGRIMEIPVNGSSPSNRELASEASDTRLSGTGTFLPQPVRMLGRLTEAEWLTCMDPVQMLEQLDGVVSDRKLRLFACACCRRVCDLFTERTEKAIEVSERYADGLASAKEIAEAQMIASWDSRGWAVWEAVGWLACKSAKGASEAAIQSIGETARLAAWEERAQMDSQDIATIAAERASRARDEEYCRQCILLRDIVGNPFRSISIDPVWLLWSDGAVRKVAQGIYDDRGFARMPLLAEALQEAGCANSDILIHCLQLEGHVLGCWVLDLLLGKS